jgi:hypothetical protein
MTATPRFDNPAARFHFIISAMRAYKASSSSSNYAVDWLRKDPAFPCATYMEALGAIQLIAKIPQGIEAEVNALDDSIISKELLLSWLPDAQIVTEQLSRSLEGISGVSLWHVPNIAARFNDLDMSSLNICADVLHRRRPETKLSGRLDEFANLLAELKDLLQNDKEMDEGLRNLLLQHVRAMALAVDKAAFWGMQVFKTALAETIGDVYLTPDLEARSGGNKHIWKKFTAVLTTMTAAFTFGTAVAQAFELNASPGEPVQVTVINQLPSVSASNQFAADPGIEKSGR